jgi:hypothetical protein
VSEVGGEVGNPDEDGARHEKEHGTKNCAGKGDDSLQQERGGHAPFAANEERSQRPPTDDLGEANATQTIEWPQSAKD